MKRWKKHDGSKRYPPGIGHETTVEFEVENGGGHLPARMLDWSYVTRFKITGGALPTDGAK
jgi:hypothetical protein